ncbi:S1C family serine protease [Tenggerimyces flavus]|uniref:S1C family serine protease n=1 Tax=Tenggerimyces flavus TaxID=1708749 RepID=A0ABV7YEM8_9ACTN|nr:trypsin-like peptidase domain-containing protein [Tenggerimyces flavus]MBM7786024.1 putative serine protease PepD [Tenggerimyces flavus]
MPPPSWRPPGYPVGRPDFEPPPAWARPSPSMPAPSTAPFGMTSFDRPAAPVSTGPRRGTLVVVAIVIALVAGAIGAVAGTYGTLRFADPVAGEPAPPINDNLGDKEKAFPKPENVATVAEAMLQSVVQIKVSSKAGKATGSGFVIRDDGHIVTNNHVIAMAATDGSITVGFDNGEEAPAKIVGRSPSYDLAVIRVTGVDNLHPVALGDSDGVIVGEPVVAIGSPLGLAGTVTSGIVSARNRPVTAGGEGENSFINALQTDAAINPGNSGGPLVNLRAEVIGVNSAIATLGQDPGAEEEQAQGNIGLGFAIPINQARRTADQIIKNGYAVYPVMGATVDVRFDGPGARVVEVTPGSAAAEAGLRTGDIVTVIDGHKVTGADDLIVQIRSHVPGQRVSLTYKRSGKEDRVTVTLGEQRG